MAPSSGVVWYHQVWYDVIIRCGVASLSGVVCVASSGVTSSGVALSVV